MPIDRLDSLKISSGSVSPSTTAASLTSPQTPTYALGSDAGRHGSPHDALVENWIDFSQCCEEGPVVSVFTQEQQEEKGEGPDTLPLGPVYVRSDLVYPKPRATPAVSFLPLAAPTSFPTSPILVRPRRQAKLPAETAKKCFPCLDRQCPKTFDKKSTWEKVRCSLRNNEYGSDIDPYLGAVAFAVALRRQG